MPLVRTEVSAEMRRRWTLRGQVQGIGFRPFVYRLANELKLRGFVRNESSAVVIEAEGSAADLERFETRLKREKPALARFEGICCETIPYTDASAFVIAASAVDDSHQVVVPADLAVCPDCLRELFDPADPRFKYPLINCTNCGPRYTIIRGMPYDRAATTMFLFTLCEKCHQQYSDPADRRFHAQPVACAKCGPSVDLLKEATKRSHGDAIQEAANLLAQGKIVAIKGLGGFHLACRADDPKAVARLRERKHRDSKPFALMCANLEVARQYVQLSDAGVAELASAAAPIVLARRTSTCNLASEVAPENHRLGVMLPYTPLHHLLFASLNQQSTINTLIMTSANVSDEPLVKDNDEAQRRLAGIADAILQHNREIERSVDDSIVIDMGAAEPVLPIRRARGYVPQSIHLAGAKADEASMGLCVGGELKNTVAVVRGNEVILSHHLGDLKHTLSFEYFKKAIGDLCRLFETWPGWIAHDLHPGYLSTQWARELSRQWNIPLLAVQHHHAHAASVLADAGYVGDALAIVCDGVGYGTDGTAWGGELLEIRSGEFVRLGHLRPMPLAGGDAAARETWRCAAGAVWNASREGLMSDEVACEKIHQLSPDLTTAELVIAILRSGRNCVESSAAGRVFDAAAAVLGVCDVNDHEARAAITLESLASSVPKVSSDKYFEVTDELEISLTPLLLHVSERRAAGDEVSCLARLFHEQFCQAWAQAAQLAAARTGIRTVGLSGGVFCNELVTKRLTALLREQGLNVLRHTRVPPNDGGIALGQAAIAVRKFQSEVG